MWEWSDGGEVLGRNAAAGAGEIPRISRNNAEICDQAAGVLRRRKEILGSLDSGGRCKSVAMTSEIGRLTRKCRLAHDSRFSFTLAVGRPRLRPERGFDE
ncbi:hypothetical protein FMEAI12_7390011 [Parafrankia sp. Ea1.12]|nr:hypothetical protein FMEAI12_7390011 [Parafrankia sp. Ea1.12]